jgi:hypothetical protein
MTEQTRSQPSMGLLLVILSFIVLSNSEVQQGLMILLSVGHHSDQLWGFLKKIGIEPKFTSIHMCFHLTSQDCG